MTEGEVVSIGADGCRGWAMIAALPRYAVTVHLVLDDRVQASAIADGSADFGNGPPLSVNCWFEINVPHAIASQIAECRVFVGESGEYLSDNKQQSKVAALHASTQMPASYRDALDRGLDASDVINLLYLDILRRPADNNGLRSRLSKLESGQASLESFRRALLDSDEYRRLSLRVRDAPGRTFSRKIIYLSSARRLKMEQHAAAFKRSDIPLRSRLLHFLPGLVAVPGAIEALVALANKGLPDQEIFFRALSTMSRRPALIVAGLHEPIHGCDGKIFSSGSQEVTLACASTLFVEGWNRPEQSSTISFRWMEQVGILLNPQPELHVERFEVYVECWYGEIDQTITAVAGDMVLACERRQADSGSTTLVFTPSNGASFLAISVALVAGAATCPWRYDGSPDMRLLSCQVTAAKFQYSGGVA